MEIEEGAPDWPELQLEYGGTIALSRADAYFIVTLDSLVRELLDETKDDPQYNESREMLAHLFRKLSVLIEAP